MSTTTPTQPSPERTLITVGRVETVFAVLFLAAVGLFATGAIGTWPDQADRDLLIGSLGLCLLAVGAAFIAVTLRLDQRRQTRRTERLAADEQRHQAVLDEIAGLRAWAEGMEERGIERHKTVLLAVRTNSRLQQNHHDGLVERIDEAARTGDNTLTNIGELMVQVRMVLDDSAARHQAIVDEMKRVAAEAMATAAAATQELDNARWQMIADGFRKEFGMPATNGNKVVPFVPRPADPSLD